MKENNSITSEEKLFCRVYTGFYGETIDKPKQLVKHCFDDVEEFIEFCEAYHKAKQMSKEQTPITAEEFFNNGGDIIESCFGTKYSKTDLNPIKFAEQYAQYREKQAVLEALEREVKLFRGKLEDDYNDNDYITGFNQGVKSCLAEVYELIESTKQK